MDPIYRRYIHKRVIYWSCRTSAIYDLPINLRYIHKRVSALVLIMLKRLCTQNCPYIIILNSLGILIKNSTFLNICDICDKYQELFQRAKCLASKSFWGPMALSLAKQHSITFVHEYLTVNWYASKGSAFWNPWRPSATFNYLVRVSHRKNLFGFQPL